MRKSHQAHGIKPVGLFYLMPYRLTISSNSSIGSPTTFDCAAFDEMDPVEAVLIAERAGLAFPLTAGQILVELPGRKFVHAQHGDGHANLRFATRALAKDTNR